MSAFLDTIYVEQFSLSELDAASQRGAAHLDRVRGRDWALWVDRDTLSMGSCYNCVLGQLCGEYAHGVHDLGLAIGMATHLGFTLPQPTSRPQHVWDQLTDCWRERIRERIPPREEA